MNNGARSNFQKQVLANIGAVHSAVDSTTKALANMTLPAIRAAHTELKQSFMGVNRKLSWVGLVLIINLILTVVSLMK